MREASGTESRQAARQGRDAAAALEAFIARWGTSAGAERAKAPRVEEILDTLVALGHARRTDSGYASA